MLSTLKSTIRPGRLICPICISHPRRNYAVTTTTHGKPEGDISAVFMSLSGAEAQELPSRFADLKSDLIRGHEEKLRASWDRLLAQLREETQVIRELGSKVIPEIDFTEIRRPSENFTKEHKKRGVCIVRGVVPQEEALRWKDDIRRYVKANPQTREQD